MGAGAGVGIFAPFPGTTATGNVVIDNTILNTALPAMARDLAEDPLRMQGVVIAYMLTVALLIPASGWIADRFGTKKIFFGAILLFSIGSLLCALSSTLTMLVGARVIQGLGGALMLPVGMLRPRTMFGVPKKGPVNQ